MKLTMKTVIGLQCYALIVVLFIASIPSAGDFETSKKTAAQTDLWADPPLSRDDQRCAIKAVNAPVVAPWWRQNVVRVDDISTKPTVDRANVRHYNDANFAIARRCQYADKTP